ncbi:MAG: ABC transporter permease subunit [Pseudomonadota bacterium]
MRRTYLQKHRQWFFQLLVLAAMAGVVWFVAYQVKLRLEAQNISTGFGFLWDRAGFDLGESLISYDGDDSYGRALLAGFSNTIKVAFSSIIAALLLGFLAAAAMLSGHAVAKTVASLYIRLIRNTPLLLQLFFWFGVFTISMPAPRDTIQIFPHVYVSNRGIYFPAPDQTLTILILVVAVGLLALLPAARALQRRRIPSEILCPIAAIAICMSIPVSLWVGWAGAELPQAGRFSITGGGAISPEFLTVFVGLSIYTSTYIAETVRGAVEAISKGQSEAAAALGMRKGQTLRLVVLPQATRIAMPSIVSELLNLVKNSSLGVAVGYPELVSAGNTAMNQTGQAIELIAIYMLFYVSINIVITKLSHILEARYEW